MSFRVVFMGTPDFAVESLKAIVNSEIELIGVITAPDKPSGRGKKLRSSSVKLFAQENNIKTILQPSNLKDPEFISELKSLKVDLFVVVAFRMLPEVVWYMPKFGTINLHASLLPNYRGAAPINWAVINGEKKTGVTSFFIQQEIDTGSIIQQKEVEITNDDTAGSLHDKLMYAGSELLLDTIINIKNNSFSAKPQLEYGDIDFKAAPKIFKDDCKINWNRNVVDVYNFIRGLSPYPTAWTEFISDDKETLSFKIFSAEIIETKENLIPGSIIFSDTQKTLTIACVSGSILIKELQQAGKKRMDTKSFLLGFSNKENYSLAT